MSLSILKQSLYLLTRVLLIACRVQTAWHNLRLCCKTVQRCSLRMCAFAARRRNGSRVTRVLMKDSPVLAGFSCDQHLSLLRRTRFSDETRSCALRALNFFLYFLIFCGFSRRWYQLMISADDISWQILLLYLIRLYFKKYNYIYVHIEFSSANLFHI